MDGWHVDDLLILAVAIAVAGLNTLAVRRTLQRMERGETKPIYAARLIYQYRAASARFDENNPRHVAITLCVDLVGLEIEGIGRILVANRRPAIAQQTRVLVHSQPRCVRRAFHRAFYD